MKKKSLLLAVVLLGAAMLFMGCGQKSGGNQAQQNDSKEQEEKNVGSSGPVAKDISLSIVTGGTGGTYYPLGGQMAQIIKDVAGYSATAQTSNASEENVKLISAKEADIAFTQSDIASYAVNGELMFQGKKADSLRGIGTLYPETVQIVTLQSSGIQSVQDLKGKKVSVGAPGSGTFANAQQILEIHGLTMEDIQPLHLSFAESTDGLQDGSIDAAFITAGTPTAAVDGLSALKPVNIVPIAEDKIAELIRKHPFYSEDTVTAGSYGLKSDVKTVAVLAMLVTHQDAEEDVIYNVTKAIFENTDKIGHAKGAFIKPETALNGMGIPLHPGAEKYYKEKGILK